MSVRNRKNLQRLKSLVSELSDRDEQLKRDANLFEDFFDNFPLPVTTWSIGQNGVILSQRGNGFVCAEAKTIEDLFLCSKIKNVSIPHHHSALKGEKVDYMVQSGDRSFFVKLVPRHDDYVAICGVTGVWWDVSQSMTMVSCLETIRELTEGRRGDYKKVHQESSTALKASRLRQMILNTEE